MLQMVIKTLGDQLTAEQTSSKLTQSNLSQSRGSQREYRIQLRNCVTNDQENPISKLDV